MVRLELGRARSPSAQVCAALARALQLSDPEQEHLFRLAGHVPHTARVPRLVPASVRRIVDQLDGHPIGIFDAMWTLLSWNPLWAALVGDPSGLDERARNVVWGHFTVGPAPRVRQTAEESRAFESSTVADLRAATGRYPDDPDLADLVHDLCRIGAFAALWSRGVVAAHEQSRKTMVHPEVGGIDIDCDVLATQRSDLRVVVFSPRPGTDARSKLELLAALGTQSLRAGLRT